MRPPPLCLRQRDIGRSTQGRRSIDQQLDPELILDVYWTPFCRRRKGLALEAVQLMMAFAFAHLSTTKLRAKIGVANAASINLFHKLVRTSFSNHHMCC